MPCVITTPVAPSATAERAHASARMIVGSSREGLGSIASVSARTSATAARPGTAVVSRSAVRVGTTAPPASSVAVIAMVPPSAPIATVSRVTGPASPTGVGAG